MIIKYRKWLEIRKLLKIMGKKWKLWEIIGKYGKFR